MIVAQRSRSATAIVFAAAGPPCGVTTIRRLTARWWRRCSARRADALSLTANEVLPVPVECLVCEPTRTCLARLGRCLDRKRLETRTVTTHCDGPAGVVTEPRSTTPF